MSPLPRKGSQNISVAADYAQETNIRSASNGLYQFPPHEQRKVSCRLGFRKSALQTAHSLIHIASSVSCSATQR